MTIDTAPTPNTIETPSIGNIVGTLYQSYAEMGQQIVPETNKTYGQTLRNEVKAILDSNPEIGQQLTDALNSELSVLDGELGQLRQSMQGLILEATDSPNKDELIQRYFNEDQQSQGVRIERVKIFSKALGWLEAQTEQ